MEADDLASADDLWWSWAVLATSDRLPDGATAELDQDEHVLSYSYGDSWACMQRIGGGTLPLAVIDYAHTPDALEKALTALRLAVEAGRELTCVFGCGGDRDKGKRPEMGAIAARLADHVVITSDNPRSEDPQAIIEQIAGGISGKEFLKIRDRREATGEAHRGS